MVIILFSSLSMKQKYRFGTTEIFFIVNYFWAQQKQEKQGIGYGLIWNSIIDHGGNLRAILLH